YLSHLVFSFTDTATSYIYTLSLHDALPIYLLPFRFPHLLSQNFFECWLVFHQLIPRLIHQVRRLKNLLTLVIPLLFHQMFYQLRSEEHTSELQSRENLVCRLLLEKKKTYKI